MKPKRLKTYRSKLSRIIIGLSVCVIAAMTIINILANVGNITRQIADARKNEVKLISDSVDKICRNLNVIADMMETNYLKRSLVRESLTVSEASALSGYLDYSIMSQNFTVSDMEMPFYVTIVGINGFCYTSQQNRRNYDFFWMQHTIWFSECRSSGSQFGFVTRVKDLQADGEPKNIFLRYENLQDEAGNYLGTMLLCVDESILRKIYENIQSDNVEILLLNERFKVFGRDGDNLRTSPDEEMLTFLKSSDEEYAAQRGFGRLMTKHRSDYTGWTVLETISAASMFNEYRGMLLQSVFIGALFLAVTMILIRYFARILTNPLNEFCHSLENYNEMEEIQKPVRNDIREIDQLYNSYSIMHGKNIELMKERVENERLAKYQEIRFLRAQINPHFLYNTLFSIRCTVDMKKNADASKMLDILVDMLRKNLHSGGIVHEIGEEMISIRDYVALAQYGYEKKLNLEIQIEKGMETCYIMRFLLQPLVENAIFHGIEQKYEDGTIRIEVRKEDGKAVVSVTDDGLGIPPEILRRINESDSEGEYSGHIGLDNIRKRIRTNYGEAYGLVIRSAEGEGTEATMILPLLYHESDEIGDRSAE